LKIPSKVVKIGEAVMKGDSRYNESE